MSMTHIRHIFITLVCLIMMAPQQINAQQILVESVAAIVGEEIILLSTIEDRVYQLQQSGDRRPYDEIKADALRDALTTKLFIDQAKLDSIIVTTTYIDEQVNASLNEAIVSAGSEEVLEQYFHKTIAEIKRDMRQNYIDQETVLQVQNNIVQDVMITPRDVRRFYSEIEQDSLPIIPAKVQVSIIQFDPPDYEDSRMEARDRLLEIRNRIMGGQDFGMMAVLYSEDPGTASKGGEVGFSMRNQLDKNYADAAFSLTPGSTSAIVESQFGFHIIQLIDSRNDMVNTRHILIRPKVNAEQSARAIYSLDSLAQVIRKDSISFSEAAIKYSTHADSRTNGGRYVNANPSDRTDWITLENFNTEMYSHIRNLKIGEISETFSTTDEKGNTVFRIVRLDNELPAHRANIKDDYQLIYNGAVSQKQNELYFDWIAEKIKTTYIKISDECASYPFLKEEGWIE